MSGTKASTSQYEIRGSSYRVHSFAGGEPSVLALHGFTGSGLDFGPMADALGRAMQCPDLPGHGGTVVDPEAELGIEAAAGDLVRLAQGLGLRRPVLLGYSMGGRTALTLSRLHPDFAGALILIGASPGLHDLDEREERRSADEAAACELESSGAAGFIARWQELPLLRSQRRMQPDQWQAFSARRCAADAVGLASSLRTMGTGSMPPLWDRLGEVSTPTLLITGEEDVRYTAIARDMAGQMAAAQCRTIAGAGHSPHLERPAVVAEVVLDFLGGLR